MKAFCLYVFISNFNSINRYREGRERSRDKDRRGRSTDKDHASEDLSNTEDKFKGSLSEGLVMPKEDSDEDE